MSSYTDWLSSTDLGADVVGDPSGATDPTNGVPANGASGEGSTLLPRRDRAPMWRRSPSSWLQDDWSLPAPTQALAEGGTTLHRRRSIMDDLAGRRRRMEEMADAEDDSDDDEDMETDLDREHAEATQWLHSTMEGQLRGLPGSAARARAARGLTGRHSAVINALLAGSSESNRRIPPRDIATGTYEDIIDAERIGDDWGPSSSFTVPTNAGINAALHGFTPAVVGSGTTSANHSPSVIPIPTMPTSSRFKRRRTTTGDSRRQSTSRRLGTLNTRMEPTPELTTEQMPKYMHLSRTAVVSLPTELNAYDMCQRLALTPHDGHALQVEFVGDGKGGDADAAAVRTDNPIPKGCGVYYFEAEVICQGKHGYIAIGLCTRSVRLDRLTGWEPGSFAWHLDDGFVFKSQGQGTNLGWPKSGTGDTIGCGVDVDGTVFFTKNGTLVGKAFKIQSVDNDELYPAIGLRSPREQLRLNFGLSHQPFKYDIEGHVARTQALVLEEIASTPVYITRSTISTSADGVSTPLSEDARPSAKKSKGEDGTPVFRQEKAGLSKPPNRNLPPAAKSWNGFEEEEREREEVEQEEERKEAEKVVGSQVLPRDRRIVEDIETPLADVVLDYLQHSGFLNAAKALRPAIAARRENMLTGIAENPKIIPPDTGKDDEFADRVKSIWKAMVEWDIPTVLDLGALELEGTHWTFTLSMMSFYHLVNTLWADQPITEKWRLALAQLEVGLPKPEAQVHDIVVEVGMSLQRLYGDMEDVKVQKIMSDAFSLVTYSTADEVPVELSRAYSVEERERLADDLVRDLRLHAGRPAQSRLEQALRQTSYTMGSLGSVFGVNAAAYAGMDV